MVEERQWDAHIKTKAHRVQVQKRSGTSSRRRNEKTQRQENSDTGIDAVVEVADDANIQSS